MLHLIINTFENEICHIKGKEIISDKNTLVSCQESISVLIALKSNLQEAQFAVFSGFFLL